MRSPTLVIIAGMAVGVGVLGAGVAGAADGGAWSRVGQGAPFELVSAAGEAAEAPALATASFTVLDAASGAPVRSGTLSWLVPGAPPELSQASWSADDGRLDLPCRGGEALIIAASGYAPLTAVTSTDGRRHSLLLRPQGALRLELQPTTTARLWLARQDQINVTHLFANVAEPYDSDANGRIEVRDLDREASYVGVITADGRAPLVGSFQGLPLEQTLGLEEGLAVGGTVRDEQGQPIAGARVEAMGEISALDNFRYRQLAIADGSGAFWVTGLLAGTVRVNACAPGRACAEVAAELVAETAPPALALELPPGQDLVLRVENEAGEAVADATVYLQDRLHRTDSNGRLELPGLPRGASLPLKIFGRGFGLWEGELATDRARVTIVVPGGAAIERQVLSARRFDAGEVKVRWQASTAEGRETSAGAGTWDPEQGVASAVGLPAGFYTLAVRLPGSATIVSERVEVAVGERVVLPAAVPERGLAIAGRVLDGETLQPVAGARVSCEPGSPEVFRPPDVVEDLPSALSDADGMFLLEGLDPGSCRAIVHAAGFAPWRLDGVEPDDAGLDIGDIELDRGMTVVGRVTERGERAITGAVVEITEAASYAYYPEATVRTDHDGYFRAERLPVGRWTVTARHAESTARETVVGRAGETVELDLRLGGIRIEGEVWLGDARAAGGTLVLTTDGAQATGVVVMMQRLTADRQIFGVDREPIQLAVAGDGRFAGAGLEAGRYYASYTPPVAGAAPVTRTLDVPPVESFQCAIRYADAAVEGLVIDSDGEPVAGAAVVASAGSGIQEVSAFTDADGRFAMRGLEAGRLVLSASHTEYSPAEPAELELREGDAEGPVVLELGPPEGASIVLAVHTAAGSAGGAPVYLVGPETATGFTDTGGLATFAGVAAGSYRPCGIAYGGATGCGSELAVDRGEYLEARLELGRGGWVDVVLDTGDGAVAGVAKRAGSEPAKRMPQVRVMTADGVDLSALLFMASPPQPTAGGLRVGPLQADDYLISVGVGGAPRQGRVRVVEGRPAELDLR